jgi:argininosuccinate lyase
VRLSYERGLTPAQATTELLDEAALEYMGEPIRMSNEAFQRAMDPWESVNRRILYGGPAPEECRHRLPEYLAQLESDKKILADDGGVVFL